MFIYFVEKLSLKVKQVMNATFFSKVLGLLSGPLEYLLSNVRK